MDRKKKMKDRRSPKNNNVSGKLKKIILSYLHQHQPKSFNHKQITSALNLQKPSEREKVIKALNQMTNAGMLRTDNRGKYSVNPKQVDTLIGKIDFTGSGSAYVIVEEVEEDIFIPKNKTKDSLNGDTVSILVMPAGKGKKEGEVVSVIERKRTQFVGKVQFNDNAKYAFVVPESRGMHVDFFVAKRDLGEAVNNDLVLVDFIDWESKEDNPRGKVVEVLGQAGNHHVEIHAILLEYGLPYQFPKEVELEANELDTRILEDEVKNRRDMRETPTFTIDPKDAKDFDDALSVKKLENGHWEIGVHIADVSHYVKPGTLLDEEAYARATSVYLVDRVVPMLPEVLSNEACSLRPKEDKYTFSAVFDIDENAKIHQQWFGRTVTHSNRRFTYEEAQEIIEGAEGDMKEEILLLDKLAKIMRKDRLAHGAITFDKVEVKFNLNEANEPTEVIFKQSKDANHLIEEFMLLCNRKVSEFISLNKDGSLSNKTYLYRVHDNPDLEKLHNLKMIVRSFGYQLDLSNPDKIAQSLNQLLRDVKGKPEANMIETLAMRSMSKAIYSSKNLGHYGLGFEYYTHFTSPIRRYPDVIAHRLLQHYLEGKKPPVAEKVEKQCKHSSARERLATNAERDSIKYMQVKYMEQFVGEELRAVISGVTDWGIFVELPDTLAEGLIRLRDMEDDRYVYDAKNHSVHGKNKGKTYQLGDWVMVKLLRTDLEKKEIDFKLLG